MSDELIHTAEGTEWSKHKYIRKEGDRYIYPEDLQTEAANYAKTSTSNRSSSKLSDKGKELWNYVKKDIGDEKKAAKEEAKSEHDKKIEELRSKAEATRERISAVLQEPNDRLNKTSSARREQISSQRKSESESLQKEKSEQLKAIEEARKRKIKRIQSQTVSEDLNRNQRQRLAYEKQAKIDRLNAQADSDKEAVNSDYTSKNARSVNSAKAQSTALSDVTSTARKNFRAGANSQRKWVAAELKTAIAATREAYKKAKEGIDTSYEEVFQEEYDRILATYPYVKKGRTKSTKNTNSRKEADVTKPGSSRAEKEGPDLDKNTRRTRVRK